MNPILESLMREASKLTQSGHLKEATAAIQRALAGSSSPPPADQPPPYVNSVGMATHAAWHAKSPVREQGEEGMVIDVQARTIPEGQDGRNSAAANTDLGAGTDTNDADTGSGSDSGPADGEFVSGTHTHASLTRHYKLYIPPGHTGRSLPMVVMLHGCTQNPDDFAAGTGMNERARAQGFFVLYPAQGQDANPSRCWNWFKHTHQRRGSGEPAVLADMTQSIVAKYGLDTQRVYIAGLSAGGAMAAIVAGLYPDMFAAVGVHSGLAAGAATNLSEALAAMKSGPADSKAKSPVFGTPRAASAEPPSPVPTIVFHGDNDQTVHPCNGDSVIEAALGKAGADASVLHGVSPGGSRYTRTSYAVHPGKARAEYWLVHGAGHAWSGGHSSGSYTDPKGPDATGEMLRFFLEHPHPPQPTT